MSWEYFLPLCRYGGAERHKKEESNNNCYTCLRNQIITHKSSYIIEDSNYLLIITVCKYCYEGRKNILGKCNELYFIHKKNYYKYQRNL
jgi:hypothetical protein